MPMLYLVEESYTFSFSDTFRFRYTICFRLFSSASSFHIFSTSFGLPLLPLILFTRHFILEAQNI
jgi:hypothetical protein